MNDTDPIKLSDAAARRARSLLTMLDRLAYFTVKRWPFSCYNRAAFPVYLWLIQLAGREAYRRGEI